MTFPLKPADVRCKDGTRFIVTGTPGHVVVFATFRDKAVIECGLGRYHTFHEPGDLRAEHQGMPVEIVRAYAKAHGGVAEAGEKALALLKTLPSQAEPVMGAPTDSQPPAVEEAAPEAPLPEARGANLAGRSPAEADARALDQHELGAPALQLDTLTADVIEARKLVRELEGPLLLRGKPPRHFVDERDAWMHRTTSAAGIAGRMISVTDPKLAEHPLLTEAVGLRSRLLLLRDEALARAQALASQAMRLGTG